MGYLSPFLSYDDVRKYKDTFDTPTKIHATITYAKTVWYV